MMPQAVLQYNAVRVQGSLMQLGTRPRRFIAVRRRQRSVAPAAISMVLGQGGRDFRSSRHSEEMSSSRLLQ